MQRKTVLTTILAFSFILSGCQLGFWTPTHSGSISGVVKLKTGSPDILEIGIETGQTLGFRVMRRDTLNKSVVMTDGEVIDTKTILLGIIKSNQITMTMVDEGSLNLEVTATGNLGGGGYDEAKQLLEEFRRRFGQNRSTVPEK
jgi:hypothetical protein